MTTLEAVNEILEGLGEQPRTALDTAGTSIEAEAEVFLDRHTAIMQRAGPGYMNGWWCNTVIEKTYSPNDDEHIVLTDVLRWELHSPSSTINYGESGGFIYDFTNETDEFTVDFSLNVVLNKTFTTLPYTLQALIVKVAALHFIRYKRPGEADYSLAVHEAEEAKVAALREHRTHDNSNVLETDEVTKVKGNRFVREIG